MPSLSVRLTGDDHAVVARLEKEFSILGVEVPMRRQSSAGRGSILEFADISIVPDATYCFATAITDYVVEDLEAVLVGGFLRALGYADMHELCLLDCDDKTIWRSRILWRVVDAVGESELFDLEGFIQFRLRDYLETLRSKAIESATILLIKGSKPEQTASKHAGPGNTGLVITLREI